MSYWGCLINWALASNIKNKMKCTCLFILIMIQSIVLKGQSDLLESVDFENTITQLLPQQEYDVDYNDIYDRLFTLYSSPLDLNSADRSDLQSIYILSDTQIDGIIDYKEKYGEFKSIFELMTIDGFDQALIEKLQRFVRIYDNKRLPFPQVLKNPNKHELFLRYQQVFEQKKGYTAPDTLSNGEITSRYAGGPGRLYARYLFAKSNYYSFGFTIEKDPGEQITWDPATKRYGMDYYSFHGMLENVSVFKKIIVGDYNLDFAQGLVFGSGIMIGKGTEPITTIRRNNLGLRPYRSVFESKDFSGLAISTKIGIMNINMFVSNVFRDGKILNHDTIGEEIDLYTTYINSVGLHRTSSEINSKHNIKDQSAGGNANLKLFNDRLEFGINAVFNRYNVSLNPENKLHRIYQYRGRTNYNASTYFNFYFKKGHIFSELAISKSGGMASSSGVIVNLSSHVQTSIHYRNYSRSYHSYTGNAFSESGYGSNEQGLYWGIKVHPTDRLLLTAYFDYFSFPWVKYRIDAPSEGKDFMASLQYELSPKSRCRLQYRNKVKSQNFKAEDDPLPAIISKQTSRIIFDLDYQVNHQFAFRTWVQKTNVKYPIHQSKGFMMAQDVTFTSEKLSLSGRFSVFDSDDYGSRMYIYERDLLYAYSVPSFYNKGIRYYLLSSYHFSKKLTVWLKFSKTNLFNVSSIGSGLEKIEGNKKTNIGMQLRYKF